MNIPQINRWMEGNYIVIGCGMRELCRVSTANGWADAEEIAQIIVAALKKSGQVP
jgi:hypothetical protein